MSGLEERIATNLVRADIPVDARIVLACSGGVDSVVLARTLSRMVRSGSTMLAHANHGLRGTESDGDESFVREFAEACGMGFISTRLPVAEYARESGRSIEEAGRTLRYEWLERVLADQGATAILTAHHLDDLAETMIYRLARGTGLRGLRAMSLRQGNIVRPILDVARSEIETYAREHDIVFRQDSTNTDTAYARNLICHEILPRMENVHPEYRRALERFSRYAADCADFLDDSVREFLADADFFEISAFRVRSDFLQREILRYLYESVHGSTLGLSEANI
jgi:tRNA(Ile)-lysidine synthase